MDEKFADAAWRVEYVDGVFDRVILSRSGQTVSLALHDDVVVGGGVLAQVIGESKARAIPRIERSTLDEALVELHGAGISAEELRLLVELVNEKPDATVEAFQGDRGDG